MLEIINVFRTRNITSVAIPTLVSYRRNYPPIEGAHIALRKYLKVVIIYIDWTIGTARRFLEHFDDGIDLIVFVSEQDDVSLYVCIHFVIIYFKLKVNYQVMFSLYFPRTPEEEEFSMRALPIDLGYYNDITLLFYNYKL